MSKPTDDRRCCVQIYGEGDSRWRCRNKGKVTGGRDWWCSDHAELPPVSAVEPTTPTDEITLTATREELQDVMRVLLKQDDYPPRERQMFMVKALVLLEHPLDARPN